VSCAARPYLDGQTMGPPPNPGSLNDPEEVNTPVMTIEGDGSHGEYTGSWDDLVLTNYRPDKGTSLTSGYGHAQFGALYLQGTFDEYVGQETFAMPYLEELVALRNPQLQDPTKGPIKLVDLPGASAQSWVADNTTWTDGLQTPPSLTQISPPGSFSGDLGKSS